MSNPAYLWLTDENGSPIVGGCQVAGRVGAIELREVAHDLFIPADGHTGRLTSTRVHTPLIVQKEFDRTTPILCQALCNNLILKSAAIHMYQISDAGLEKAYFTILLEKVRITRITPNLYPGAGTGTHMETIQMHYGAITWKHCEGNMICKDSWNHLAVA
ncbi:type VI secretion system tube protein Hcp [Chimaeribacter coloradensis]|uniref:Type VI secretion system tube protein Hcp n=1 Tax=Chimaeribacter coloradensis TaxID=2060068 RepID=A0A2N5E1B5_9GAMM|nr:type VI secretion system tube protein TssD [Chimaeribacter coloradensis]PLR34124.1 type VI secretion system tube protein Hcp [Chimaeribacter coloradensis]